MKGKKLGMENKPRIDRRTIKTKRAMHNALVELASIKH